MPAPGGIARKFCFASDTIATSAPSGVTAPTHCVMSCRFRAKNGSCRPPLASHTPWPSPKLVNARSCQFSIDPDPRIPERLPVLRFERGIDMHGIGPDRRLPLEPQIFERIRALRVQPLLTHGRLGARLHGDSRCGSVTSVRASRRASDRPRRSW